VFVVQFSFFFIKELFKSNTDSVLIYYNFKQNLTNI